MGILSLEMSLNHFHKHNLRHLPRFPDFFVTFRILSPSSGNLVLLERILRNQDYLLNNVDTRTRFQEYELKRQETRNNFELLSNPRFSCYHSIPLSCRLKPFPANESLMAGLVSSVPLFLFDCLEHWWCAVRFVKGMIQRERDSNKELVNRTSVGNLSTVQESKAKEVPEFDFLLLWLSS